MADPFDRLAAVLADRYRLERELGVGGMATVYLAEDVKHRRKVAVKVFRSELAATLGPERFAQEIEIAARLTHPHILSVHDSGRADGLLYYVMPYVDGESLRDRIARGGPMPIGDAVRILRDIADGLAYAHQQGVIHRDIKPENVMLTGRHALVADFGVAKAVREATGPSRLTTAGIALGTPTYMAPEQAAADPATDHRADLYAFGVLGYELLTGRPPFLGASPQEVLAAHVTVAPEPINRHRADLPPSLAHLVMKCLAKRPADRWQTAGELVSALESMMTPSGGNSPVSSPRRRWTRATASLVVVALFIGFGWWRWHARVPVQGPGPSNSQSAEGGVIREIKSIAVLPLVNVGGDSTQEYFADGMTDELANALGKVPGLRVAARTSSYAFKGHRELDIGEVGRKLNVAVALQGTVRRTGTGLRVSVQLIDTQNAVELWSESYDRQLRDAFAVQDSITRAVVEQLTLHLGGLELASSRAGRTVSPEAHDWYLQGLVLAHQSSEQAVRRSLEYFRLALRKDPQYAQAYAGIAWAHAQLADAYMTGVVSYDSSRIAARQALRYDSLVAEARGSLAFATIALDWDFATGERELKRAIKLNPNSVELRFEHAVYLCDSPETWADGLAEADRAIAIDPLAPFSSYVREYCLYFGHRYEETVAQHKRTVAIDPSFHVYYDDFAGMAYAQMGRYREALEEYRQAQQFAGAAPLPGHAATYARMGNAVEARRMLDRIERYARDHYINPIGIATVYTALGEKDRAFEWLDRSLDDHSIVVIALNAYPDLEPLHSDPRFTALLKRIGFGVR